MTTFDGLDLVAHERYGANGYPHEQLTTLRRKSPISYFEPEGYPGFWAVTKHADIIEVSRQPELFGNAPRLNITSLVREAAQADGPPLRAIVQMDPPDHPVYRKIASRWFTPRQSSRLRDRMEASAKDLVDWMAAQGPDRSYDFVTDVASIHPLRLITGLFGLDDPDDEAYVLKMTNEIFGGTDPEFARDGDTSNNAAAMGDAMAFFSRIVAERLADPQDDLATEIATAEVYGEPMPQVEVLSYYFVILTAGHDTTRNALSGGLKTLLEHPDQLQRLIDDPSLCATAADEIVRWTTPVNHFARTAFTDYELGGVEISEGDTLALFYASANRDEDVYEDPFVFRVDRDPNPHLGFGVGAHFCIGAALARMEIEVFLQELVSRLDSIESTGPAEHISSNFVTGIKHLPIRASVRA